MTSTTKTTTEIRLDSRPTPPLKLFANEKRWPVSAKVKSGSELLCFEELAQWQQLDGELIRSGYRKAAPSFEQCLHSWSYLHNESVNILSHLAGAVLFVYLAVSLYSSLDPVCASQSTGDVVAIGVFMTGAATCFALSAAFHTLTCHSSHVHDTARACDFQGIIFLVLCTTAPQVYYTFKDNARLQASYWVLLISLGLLASVLTLTPTFHKPKHQAVRVALFAALGAATLAPIVHGVLAHGLEGQSRRFSVWAVVVTHAFNLAGAVVYVVQFPERYWPGTFDLFGASHQLMHVAIVGAALSLLWGSMEAFSSTQCELQFRAWKR